MAASSDVAAFRAAGHSVIETMERFGISERAVYKACSVSRARVVDQPVGAGRVLPGRAAAPAPGAARVYAAPVAELRPAAAPGARSVIPAPGAVADGVTEWRDPVSGRCEVAPAGTWARDWFAGKHLQMAPGVSAPVAPVAPVVAAPVPVPAPVPAPAAVGLAGGFAPAPAPVAVRVPVTVALHNSVAAPGVVVRLAVKPAAVDWRAYVLGWMAEYWRVPLALVVGLAVVCLCLAGVR